MSAEEWFASIIIKKRITETVVLGGGDTDYFSCIYRLSELLKKVT